MKTENEKPEPRRFYKAEYFIAESGRTWLSGMCYPDPIMCDDCERRISADYIISKFKRVVEFVEEVEP